MRQSLTTFRFGCWYQPLKSLGQVGRNRGSTDAKQEPSRLAAIREDLLNFTGSLSWDLTALGIPGEAMLSGSTQQTGELGQLKQDPGVLLLLYDNAVLQNSLLHCLPPDLAQKALYQPPKQRHTGKQVCSCVIQLNQMTYDTSSTRWTCDFMMLLFPHIFRKESVSPFCDSLHVLVL